MYRQIIILLTVLLSACTSIPDDITPVEGFDGKRYMGTWYEIARMPHGFEEGLTQVSATYSVNEDGSINVLNKGYNQAQGQWEQAIGKAVFVDDENIGHLKVSFFGPFYSSYIVFKLEKENYDYAYVSGYSTDYAWLLARSKTVDQGVIDDFKARIKAAGFDVSKLIMVEQE